MDAKNLIARLLEQREVTVELEPGKTVTLRRPAEAEIATLTGGLIRPEHVQRMAVRWSGITEADLLGTAIGSADPAPWDAELWAHVVADRTDWLARCIEAMAGAINKHFEGRAQAEKN